MFATTNYFQLCAVHMSNDWMTLFVCLRYFVVQLMCKMSCKMVVGLEFAMCIRPSDILVPKFSTSISKGACQQCK